MARLPSPLPQTRALGTALAVCLAIFTILRVVFLAVNWDVYAGFAPAALLRAFLAGARFDLHVTAVFLTLPFLLLHVPGEWKRRPFPAALLLWAPFPFLLGGLFLAVADLPFYLEAGRHLSWELFTVAREDKASTLGMYWPYRGWLAAFFLLAGALAWCWARMARGYRKAARSGRASRRPGPAAETAWLVAVLLLLSLALRGSLEAKPIRPSQAFEAGRVELGHLVLPPLFTIEKWLTNNQGFGLLLMDEDQAERRLAALVSTEGAAFLDSRYPLFRRNGPPLPGSSRTISPNVVVLLMESWSASFVGALGGEPGATPVFDALAREGLLFKNILGVGTRSPEGFTSVTMGIPSFNSSGERNALLNGPLAQNRFRGLAAILRRRGYSSLFIRGAARDSMGLASLARVGGYERVVGWEDLKSRARDADTFEWGVMDTRLAEIMVEEFSALPRPFTALWLSLSTHVPYTLPDPSFAFFPEDSPNGPLRNTMRVSDFALGRFLELARAQPWFADTLFVIVADHPGGDLQGLSPLDRHRVPLLVYAPGRVAPGVITALGTQMDVLPTVLDLAGIDEPHHAFGRSLVRRGAGEWGFVNLGQGYGWFEEGVLVEVDPEGRRLSARDAATGMPAASEDGARGLASLQAFLQAGMALIKDDRLAPP